MSHGDGEGRRRDNESQLDSRRAKADDFARAVSRIAVAQVCESVGFEGLKESALEAFVDVAIRYLCDLGKAAGFNANLSSRTDCNLFDIIRGLEDLGFIPGFSGVSEMGSCLVGLGTVREIMRFVGYSEEIPFSQPVPRFPIVRDRRMIPSFLHMGETPPGKHIPAWLPAFPDAHTYIHTPMWNERTTDPRTDKIEQARQRRKAERALLSLQQRLLFNGSAGSSSSGTNGVDAEELQVDTRNPFLATPFKSGEKEVSEVVLPDRLSDGGVGRKVVSVLDAFAPAIEAVKEGFRDDGVGERRFLPEKRPAVHFKVRTGKKILGESMDLSLQKKGGGRTALWIGRDDERDDRKRRAEYILRQSIENPQELTQL
ncbi:Bromo_TP domain-containing protein/TAF8_C domain-containing protein [Cephalotus follicularis]|uniref:Transcription initiation factor TFIID subunit 8 n=1 Tax=Cephalotus follicularis TaxID=3775 RepID=A0A1Q3BP35_CEPFO|nr:Bromo_TP domain-containing protein/TAF8_C domain-containing protein [Cephalotus follicularis]